MTLTNAEFRPLNYLAQTCLVADRDLSQIPNLTWRLQGLNLGGRTKSVLCL